MGNLVKKIQNTNFQNGLFKNDAKIVVGVSGGPDSVCLLDVFHKLKKKYPLQIIVAHVNYGLRGDDSEKDEQFVTKLCQKYAIPLKVIRPEIRAKNNLEEKLRDLRYAFFEKIRKEEDFDLIATAHNLDDQAETFLMRLLRGSGTSGLRAMSLKRGNLIRPLLNITRREIIEYLKLNKLRYRIDKTNRQPIFLRNKIRLKLIPYLEKNYNLRIKERLFATAAALEEDYQALEEIREGLAPKSENLSCKQLLEVPVAIQKRIILEALQKISQDERIDKLSQTNEIIKAMKSSKGKIKTISSQGLKIVQRGDKMILTKEQID